MAVQASKLGGPLLAMSLNYNSSNIVCQFPDWQIIKLARQNVKIDYTSIQFPAILFFCSWDFPQSWTFSYTYEHIMCTEFHQVGCTSQWVHARHYLDIWFRTFWFSPYCLESMCEGGWRVNRLFVCMLAFFIFLCFKVNLEWVRKFSERQYAFDNKRFPIVLNMICTKWKSSGINRYNACMI